MGSQANNQFPRLASLLVFMSRDGLKLKGGGGSIKVVVGVGGGTRLLAL